MSGMVSDTTFDPLLTGQRGVSSTDPSGCTYVIRWLGSPVPGSTG